MANNHHSIGRYRITEEIASGAFGRIYRGENTSRGNTHGHILPTDTGQITISTN